MKTLYHLTWDCNVASILAFGLVPNHTPNRWAFDAANRRSRHASFLCTRERLEYWNMTYSDGWVKPAALNAKLVALEVRVPSSWLVADKARGEHYEGDFKCKRTIPAANISLVKSRRALLKAA